MFYSVPYKLTGQRVKVEYTKTSVSIYFGGERVAHHLRSNIRGKYVTVDEHMPSYYKDYVNLSPEKYITRATALSTQLGTVITKLFASNTSAPPETFYKSCDGLIHLQKVTDTELFERACGIEAEVFTATPMEPIANYYMRDKAVKVMEDGGVALMAGGTGNPFFTTDSGAALRALEIGADALLKGTRVDGVYTADPEKDPSATRYDELSFDKALGDHLKVMDATAFALCEQGNMPIIVLDMNRKGNLAELLGGSKVGTLVHK